MGPSLHRLVAALGHLALPVVVFLVAFQAFEIVMMPLVHP